MDFIVRQIASRPDTMLVRYDCSSGCKPNAEYRRGGRVPVAYATPSKPRH